MKFLFSAIPCFMLSVIFFSCADDGIDGLDGQSSLVNVAEEPAGDNCVDGGIRIETGIDINMNGTLDADEVQEISFVCDGESLADEGQTYLVLTGDITNEEAQSKVNEEVGPNTQLIIIKNTNLLTELTVSQTERLVEVQIEGNRALGTVNFPNLLQVDDNIIISNNPTDSLKLKMNSLLEVTGNIELLNNSIPIGNVDTEIQFESLERVNYIKILNNEGTIELSLPQLREVLVIEVNDNFGTGNFDFPELLELGDLYVNDNLIIDFFFNAPKLSQLFWMEIYRNEEIGDAGEIFDLSGLETVNAISVRDNSFFDSFNLESLTTVGAYIEIINNDGVQAISMENLVSISATNIAAGLTIFENSGLQSVNLASLEDPGNTFLISNSLLTDINIDGLSAFPDLDAFSLDNNSLTSETVNYVLARLVSFSPPISGKTINLQQSSAAPPTGQGLTDKATLETNGNTVNTD